MKIAIEGCAHGELDKIYEALEQLEKGNNLKVDLLIICGDFQAVRNRSDLRCMAVPPKFQKLNTFYKYYSGEKKAPVLTLFVGGNHEASNYLLELPYGGWVCPNIYYLGYANVINFGGLRIAGLSGIYKGQDYLKGHFEILPFNESSKRSVYHIRNIDVFRLKQIRKPIDIFISHDWPRGIYNYGNKEELLRRKPFFRDDMANDKLGSRPAEELLHKLCPSYWFAAHLHCKFAAVVPHTNNEVKTVTKFLALDKCLPRRNFLQIIDIEKGDNSMPLQYDPEWLCILCSTNHLLNISEKQMYMPGPGCSERWDFSVSEENIKEVAEKFLENFAVPDNFVQTAPSHSSSEMSPNIPKMYINSQTTKFCEMLGISDPLKLLLNGHPNPNTIKEYSVVEELNITNSSRLSINPDEFSLDDTDDESEAVNTKTSTDSCKMEISDSFFIDKKGSSQSSSEIQGKKLSSSERLAMHREYSEVSTTANVNLDFPTYKENAVNDAQKDSESVSETTNKEPVVKEFKRRNLSLYISNDNE